MEIVSSLLWPYHSLLPYTQPTSHNYVAKYPRKYLIFSTLQSIYHGAQRVVGAHSMIV